MSEPETLFRRKAIDHYLAAARRGEVIRVAPPSVWSLVALILAAALTVAVVLHPSFRLFFAG